MPTSFTPTALPGGAIALSTQATVLYDESFQQRVILATAYVAAEVLGEPSTDANYAARTALASEVFRLPQALNFTFTVAVLADTLTTTSATDQALITRIEAIWDDMAGVAGIA
jgi:hypothetical protein